MPTEYENEISGTGGDLSWQIEKSGNWSHPPPKMNSTYWALMEICGEILENWVITSPTNNKYNISGTHKNLLWNIENAGNQLHHPFKKTWNIGHSWKFVLKYWNIG